MQTELAKFDSIQARIVQYIEPLRGLTVRDKAENAAAAGCLTTVKGLGKEIESLRVAAVSPLNEQVKAINARAKVIMEPLEMAETAIKTKMRIFADCEAQRIAEERRQASEIAAAEQRRIDEEVKRGRAAEEEEKRAAAAFGIDPDKEARLQADRERQERETRLAREKAAAELANLARQKALDRERPVNMRTVWRFEIIEADRLEIPMEFWDISESKIGAAVRGGRREIPGVKIWSTQEVVARA